MEEVKELNPAGAANDGSKISDWTQRVILGDAVGGMSLPSWLHDSYATLRLHVMDPAYPCFFGTMAEKRGEMFYSFVHGKNIGELPATMRKFSELASLPEYEKNNIAIFFEPDVEPLSHQQYHDLFWDALQHLHDNDPDPEADHQPAPNDPKWEFSFAGVEMFVVCACPSFSARHSRNLGPGMVLLFQPRSVFVDKVTNRVIGLQAREEVRRRLKKWDAIPAHPDLGFYGDPGNLEWKQYFLPDENVAATGKCPFLNRSAAAASKGPAAQAAPQPAAQVGSAPQGDYSQEMRDISKRYASLPPPKREVFRAALAQKQIATALLPVAPLEGRGNRIPLSYAQERLWFLWKLAPASSAYNVAKTVRLQGQLDQSALRAAIDTIVGRHDILRTRFEQSEDIPWQIIDAGGGLEWHDIDLRAGQEAQQQEQQEQLERELQALSLKPFDLERGPLLRVALVRLEQSVQVLHFVMHHIICDAWSYAVLVREFTECYSAVLAGRPAVLPAMPVQYADVAVWQKEWADEKEMAKQLTYWQQRLGSEHPVLSLPNEWARKEEGGSSHEGEWVRNAIGGATLAQLAGLARAQRVTMFTVLLAAYDVLLYRYSGQNDIRVGIPAAGRNRSETENLIGFFVNTLVMRADIKGADRFDQLLQQVHGRMLEAQGNQDLPFARLVDALQPQRSLNHTPLFQAMFSFAGKPEAGAAIPGLEITTLKSDQEMVKFDLTLHVSERADQIALTFSYAKDRFNSATIANMVADYLQILEQVAQHPQAFVGTLQLHTARAKATPAPAVPALRSIAERVSESAVRWPQAEAIHCEGKRMRYGELEALANRIGRRLAQLQVRPEERVGVCVERSAGMVAAILGIMKAGAAFVPLDPGYPQERLNFMLGNAGVRRVVTDAGTIRKFPDLLDDFEIVSIDEVKTGAEQGAAAFQLPVHPQQLAYVIYTSGSTGHPKGVAVSHQALALHMDDFIASHRICQEDKVLHMSTINFDVSLHEIFPVLMQGGKLEMRGTGAWDLETTNRHLIDEHVTFSRLPTAYWQQWLRELPAAADLRHLRQITVGGEALNGDALRLWKTSPLKDIAVANLYGPTETTVACMFRHTELADAANAIVPIGAAYPSRRVHVMDEDANELPALASGELCIGGDTLARGYLERPDLTAEKFIPDPFGAYGGRLYRSGDICRAASDGTIEYFGRRDKQVKLRGFRIELGEIENLLRSVPDVREAVVELISDGGEPRLAAFIVGPYHKAEVIAYLQRQLPDYMVPTVFVKLDALPLMQNGKVNRAALPRADLAPPAAENLAPRSLLEQTLLDIWQAVLQRQDFGVTSNFFEIGGNSLSALRVAAMVKSRNIENFRLDAFFRHPTIAGFAAQLGDAGSAGLGIVALNAAQPGLRNLFVLPPSSGLVFDYRPLAGQLSGALNVIGLQFPFEQEAASWPASFDGLAARYIDSLRRVQPHGPYHLLAWSLGGLLALEIAHQLEAAGETVAFIGLVDAKTPAQRTADAAGKNRDLQRRNVAEQHELDAFWSEIRQRESGWASYLMAQEQPQRLAANIVLASNYIMHATSSGAERQVDAGLHLWWSSENVSDLDAGLATQWHGSSRGATVQVGLIAASHREIVSSKALADDLRALFASAPERG